MATVADGLPSDDVLTVVSLATGDVYAGTTRGLTRFDGHKWRTVKSVAGPVKLLALRAGGEVFVASADGLRLAKGTQLKMSWHCQPPAYLIDDLQSLAVDELAGRATVLLGTRSGLFEIVKRGFAPVEPLNNLLGSDKNVRQVAVASDGRIAVAASEGLFLGQPSGSWARPNPIDGAQSWWPARRARRRFRRKGPPVVRQSGRRRMSRWQQWSLYTAGGVAVQRLHDDCLGTGELVWFGTRRGASASTVRSGIIVRDIAGSRTMMCGQWPSQKMAMRGSPRVTVSAVWNGARPHSPEKAALFEAMIDKYHRRTPYGFVCDVHLPHPGDLSRVRQHDDDNDGLWTGMYGAGECFAYAATHDPLAKNGPKPRSSAAVFEPGHARRAHPAPKGFPARSIRSTSGADPNQQQKANKIRRAATAGADPRDKVITPRWPTSADGNGTGNPIPAPTNSTATISLMPAITTWSPTAKPSGSGFAMWLPT